MDFDTLEKVAVYLQTHGYEIHITDVNVDEKWDMIEAACVGGDTYHLPGQQEVELNIRASLIKKDLHSSHLDEIKNAVKLFDESVKPLTENYGE